MDQLIKTEKQELAKSTVNSFTRHLMNSIKTGDLLEVELSLNRFKDKGLIKYENLLSIPVKDRLPGLVEQYGAKRIHQLLVVLLTEFCNTFNVIRPMSANQIVSCASEILNTSNEDYLSMEDLTIFFQGAKTGKYGKVYDRLDQQMIFEMLEIYRQERHEQYQNIKDEQHVNLKALGPSFRNVDDSTELKELFHQANLEHFKQSHEKPLP